MCVCTYMYVGACVRACVGLGSGEWLRGVVCWVGDG